jgi:hypothetical protein
MKTPVGGRKPDNLTLSSTPCGAVSGSDRRDWSGRRIWIEFI